jgi:hypothetical protein
VRFQKRHGTVRVIVVVAKSVHADRSGSLDELRRFFRFLEDRRLFLLDVEGCSFLFRNGRLAVVDLESLFPVETTVADLVRSRTRKSAIEQDDYEKQLRYVARRVLKHRGTEDTETGG